MLPPPYLEVGLSYPVRALESDGMLDEITDAAERISGLLASAKQYTQMDRAPLQTIRHARRPRRHLDDARPQARRGHRDRPRLRPQSPEDLRLPRGAESGVDEPHRQRRRCHGRRRQAHGANTSLGDDRIMVEIGDTGPGVPDEVRDPRVRAVLHHEGGRQGNRPRSRHRVADHRRPPQRRDPAGVDAGRYSVPGRPSKQASRQPGRQSVEMHRGVVG